MFGITPLETHGERNEILEIKSTDFIDGIYNLKYHYKNVKTMELLTSNIPLMRYNLKNASVRYTDGATNTTYSLEDGYYSEAGLLSTLNTDLFGIATFTGSSITKKVTIVITSGTGTLHFSEVAALSLATTLGFNTDIINTTISPGNFSLNGDLSTYINFVGLGHQPVHSSGNHFTYICPVASPGPNSTLILHRQHYPQVIRMENENLINLKSFEIEMKGSDGLPLDVNLPWSITILLGY
jgi:hypothetical protein